MGTSEWPDRLYEDVDGKNEPDEEEDAPGNWKSWNFQFSKREPFMLKADWYLGETGYALGLGLVCTRLGGHFGIAFKAYAYVNAITT